VPLTVSLAGLALCLSLCLPTVSLTVSLTMSLTVSFTVSPHCVSSPCPSLCPSLCLLTVSRVASLTSSLAVSGGGGEKDDEDHAKVYPAKAPGLHESMRKVGTG
jgi:hypothetical protein